MLTKEELDELKALPKINLVATQGANDDKELFDLVEEALANEKYVKIKGLGVFKLIEVDSRESINVNTGERIEIQGHSKVSFTPETSLKELINKPFAHFETVILNEGTVLEDTQVEVDVINEEIRVLEVQHKRKNNTCCRPGKRYRDTLLLSEFLHKNTENIADHNGNDHQKCILDASPCIEQKAERKQNHILELKRNSKVQY